MAKNPFLLTVRELLEKHPLPWERGEEHEYMTGVHDANGKLVTVLKLGVDGDWANVEALKTLILAAVNSFDASTLPEDKPAPVPTETQFYVSPPLWDFLARSGDIHA